MSMTSYTLDATCARVDKGRSASVDPLPAPSVPPDQTNM